MNFSFHNFSWKNRRFRKIVIIASLALLAIGLFMYILETKLVTNYNNLESVVITDRNGELITIKQNNKGNYASYTQSLPVRFKDMLIRKEDRFFYFHFGLNPFSVLRATIVYLKSGVPGASSTITQQLVKNLLGNERNRTFENKLTEAFYTLALELFLSKETILTMYGNTVYMGNQLQGFGEAAEGYFGKKLDDLNDTERLSLLSTVSSPSTFNPWKTANRISLQVLAKRLDISTDLQSLIVKKSFNGLSDSDFELEYLGDCHQSCTVTLDRNLSDKLREILRRNIAETSAYGGRNGALVVIKMPENELLAVIGTPNIGNSLSGSAINMALNPRPIGSTIKPFIYLKGFEKGLRPYTEVTDREYKFSIATGYPLYPKNYDGLYRGTITLEAGLSNSLNVPTVKTLQYISLSEFYAFLERTLEFKPLQPVDSYQYGIALGGLEMDPLTLAHLMTVFASKGELKPLTLYLNNISSTIVPPMEANADTKHVSDEKFVQLVNKILTNRIAGVEQFGLKGNLNLSQNNYAVKTGTSRDFHDTWTVGFTPDFLVAVWLGNVENEPMRQITSSSGAGKIWHDAMELLINSPYNKKTSFDFSKLAQYKIAGEIQYGLPGDDVEMHKYLLADTSLILNPHDGDTFSFETTTEIPLKAGASARWYSNGKFIGEAEEISFHPIAPGSYTLRATTPDKEEVVEIRVVKP